MKRFLNSSLVVGILISIILSSIIIYRQLSAMAQYKDIVLGTTSDYLALQEEYAEYKREAGNSKQSIIITQSENSNINQMAEIIRNYSQKVDGQISIYFKNLTTNESVILNSDKEYYMASLYKVILALYLLDKIGSNDLSFEDEVGTTSATLEFALEKIITESNNEYAVMLADQYGWFNIENQMKKKLGIEFSLGADLAISVKNVGILFEEIATPTKIPKSESEHLLGLLKNQKLRSKLPKYLPSTARIHNKTGEFEDYSHDAGIFYTPKANYILIFMSKSKSPGVTNEQMALMSKEIYDVLSFG